MFRIAAMPEGTIKKLTEKGFGFIETSKGQDLFFHSSSVEGIDYDSLREGQRVSFNEGRGPKGPRAENVRPL
jgi:CspA family cold shock protein